MMFSYQEQRKMGIDWVERNGHAPCRFCGSRYLDTVAFEEWWEPEGWHVVCNDCGACGPGAKKEDGAWELWDRPQPGQEKE